MKEGKWSCFHFGYCSVVSNSLSPHGLQHVRLPRYLWGWSNSFPLSQWWNLIIWSSVAPFSFWPLSLSMSGSFSVSQLFISGGEIIGDSALASLLPMNIQGWFPLGRTGLISLMSKVLSRVFFSTTVWKHQFFGTQSFHGWSNSHIRTWLLDKP